MNNIHRAYLGDIERDEKSITVAMLFLIAEGLNPDSAIGGQTERFSTPTILSATTNYEWEPAKQLASAPEAIAAAEDKAVKIVSPLLPPAWRYEVVFMRRDAASILRSQETMLGGLGSELRLDELDRHVADTLAWAAAQPNIRILELDYDSLVEAPETAIARLLEFLGPARLKRSAALRGAIKPELRHHARSGEPGAAPAP